MASSYHSLAVLKYKDDDEGNSCTQMYVMLCTFFLNMSTCCCQEGKMSPSDSHATGNITYATTTDPAVKEANIIIYADSKTIT